jgi:hypothetical protein
MSEHSTPNETVTDTSTRPRSARTSLVNRRRLRRYALDAAGQRHHRFTRVGEEFYQTADAHLRAWVRDYIHGLPSKGKTIH